MERLKKIPSSQSILAKEQIFPKRQKEALLSAEQEPSLAWSQIKESCEPLVPVSAGCCPECLIFVPKNSVADLFTEVFSKRCLGWAQQLPLLLSGHTWRVWVIYGFQLLPEALLLARQGLLQHGEEPWNDRYNRWPQLLPWFGTPCQNRARHTRLCMAG